MKFVPIPDNENERLRALLNYQILDTQTEQEFDRLTELASIICETPISLVSFVDEKRQWFKSRKGLDVRETSRDLAFCQYAIMGDKLFEVEDATRDERFRTNELVTGKPDIRFYAGFPLVDPGGYSLGTLCVIDTKTRQLTSQQKNALKLLADQAISLIIDQRKRVELRYFEKLFQMSNDLVCIAGADGYFRKINPAFEELLGWDEEFLLKTAFFEFIHPEDLEKTYQEMARLSDGQITINFVHRFRTKNGKYLHLQWTATPEPDTGNLFCIARNITEEKNREDKLRISEENFRSFFENSQGLMCTHDINGNFLTVNSAGAELLGYTTEEVLKISLFDLVPEKHHHILQAYLKEISNTGKASGLMSTVHKNGTYRIWSYHNILVKSLDGTAHVVGNSIDITESHQMAKSLQKTQEMLLQTNRTARVGGWEVDLVKGIINWSEVTKEIHQIPPGFEPSLDVAMNFYQDGESREKIEKAIDLALTEGIGFDLELELRTAKGEDLWVRAIGNSDMENGVCKRLHGTFQDIDAKKRAELEFRNSKKLLDDVLNAASEVSIIATDTSGIITVFNKGAEKLLGYTAEEMVGKSTSSIIHLEEEILSRSEELSRDYHMPVEGFKTLVYKAEREGSEIREWTYRKKNGTLFPVSLVVTTIRDVNNTIIGYLGVASDLSARKQAEEELVIQSARLLAFVEHAPAAVAMLDKDIRYLAISHRWLEEYRLVGQDIIGKSHYEVFPSIDENWKEVHQRSLKGAVITKEEESWRPPGWDQDQYLKWEVRPWYQFDGVVGGIMIFTQDITETALRREELKQAKIQAEQASIAKSEFLANMSHEIRTPLNGVIGFTDLVLKTKMTDTQKQYLGIVNQSANALLSIINDILDFSKIEAGKLELDIDKCDIYEIASQSADIISFPVQSKGLEMLLNIPSDLPRFVWVDEIRLKQVLINLLSNAAKFTENGEIELKIEILKYNPTESEHIMCRFSVRDTGIGIREDKQNKIFEAFLQEDGSTTKKYGGTGLGLTISNKLLGMMGSRLQLKSFPGVGSTFFFDLAMRSETGEAIEWENLDSIKRVLIVDDNDNNRIILAEMLRLLKIESDQASNGFDALNILARGETFDAVLMDYHMPYQDGLETIRQIRETFFMNADELPIVLLNSSADDATVLKGCEELDINYRLIKPVKLHDIFLSLTRLSQKEKAEEQSNIEIQHEISNGKLLIVIAEDNPVNMFLAKTIIGKISPNSKILEAENGLKAVEICKKQLPDLIFMDVQMPEMNGYEATLAIRELVTSRHIPIIALTAGNVKGERDKCLEVGMDDFISKPFVEDAIWQIFQKYTGLTNGNAVSEQKAEMIQNEHIDIDKLKAVYMSDDEFIAEFLELTRDSLIKNLDDLKASLASANLSEIKAAGHKLKGASAAAYLTEVTKIAGILEYMESFDKKIITELLDKLESEIEFLKPFLVK
ncbi:PAS domain S-box protein [Dyadobacter sp. CY345]|uniref:PAS domain S-box protein n=1 Tax=Dyadobacter sp. CY345 TaxID=2909335 RepID=UPI001F32B787|nr:PAS domain S-box protein [Dyadobacter sp. CY345]MCF2443690.1 PAS domain S-box protein [Dyadobacter sp. CY345]